MTSIQEEAWAGSFGSRYTERNIGLIGANVEFFRRTGVVQMVQHVVHEPRILELGCGSGQNLAALSHLMPAAALAGVDINADAVHAARHIVPRAVFRCQSVFNPFPTGPAGPWDVVLTKGLLIHIPASSLPRMYDLLYQATRRYILIAEYYAPQREEILYRGLSSMLWKGPFADELLDRHGDLKVVNYGFVWRRDPMCPQDDLTWWLLEKP